MEENNFLNGNKKPTPTDAALAKCYFPLLVEINSKQEEVTFKKFLVMAKSKHPNNEAVQNAIPVSTGRRLEYVRIFTKANNLPDLSAWIVSQAGTHGDAFLADFDPDAEREACKTADWSEYVDSFESYTAKLDKIAIKMKRRKKAECARLIGEFYLKVKDDLPNPKNLPQVELVKKYRPSIEENLMEGMDVEMAFAVLLSDFAYEEPRIN